MAHYAGRPSTFIGIFLHWKIHFLLTHNGNVIYWRMSSSTTSRFWFRIYSMRYATTNRQILWQIFDFLLPESVINIFSIKCCCFAISLPLLLLYFPFYFLACIVESTTVNRLQIHLSFCMPYLWICYSISTNLGHPSFYFPYIYIFPLRFPRQKLCNANTQ